jgi:glycosyltransferase involved in cell wall biosynthesis
MHIVHVTPHLPPDQAANALLPWQLGEWARDAGDTVEYVAHPPRQAPSRGSGHRWSTMSGHTLAGGVTWIPRRTGGLVDRGLRLGAITGTYRVWRAMSAALGRADLVHVHSNGLLPELAVLLARRAGRPVVLTLYGTEIWHYRPKNAGVDLFTRAYRAASAVTFYSARLMSRAHELGLARRDLHVVYPPVPERFAWHDEAAQAGARADLHVPNRHLLLNVKRLHPLAGQRDLIEAMTDVVRRHPDTRLLICGTGALLEQLESDARSAGVERHVSFPGLVDNATIARYCAAADLFVLPSLLEALPTVAVEALACGTPVLSSDNPGGLELNDLFGSDVSIVPREQPIPLGAAISDFLDEKRRTRPATREIIERTFRPAAVAAQYRAIYDSTRSEAAA